LFIFRVLFLLTLRYAAKNIYYALVMPAVLFGCNQETEQAYVAAIEVVESASGNTGGLYFFCQGSSVALSNPDKSLSGPT
tara:strand:- start:1368 stop:1607 length:240 start_codon:yes stop_codon:yes gene_type:complete